MNRCHAKTKHGTPCHGFAIADSLYCFTHEPSRAAERAVAHKRGGTNRPRPTNEKPFPSGIDVKTAVGLLGLLETVMKDVWQLESSITRGRTLGYLAQVQKGILEIGEIEQRVTALENILKTREEASQ